MKKLLALMAVAALAIMAFAGTAGAQRTYLGCGGSASAYCCDMDIAYGYAAPASCYDACRATPLTLANHSLTTVCTDGNCPGTVVGATSTGNIDLSYCRYSPRETPCVIYCPDNGVTHLNYMYSAELGKWQVAFIGDTGNGCETDYTVTINN